MTTRSTLLAEIDAFLRDANLSERAFSIAVYGDHRFVKRLRSGRSITLASIEKAEEFIAGHRGSAGQVGNTNLPPADRDRAA
jgi:hypothetical protein